MKTKDQEAFVKWVAELPSKVIEESKSHRDILDPKSMPMIIWEAALTHERQRSFCPQCSSANKKRIKEEKTGLLYDSCLDCGETWSDPVTTVRNELTKERQRSAKLVEALEYVEQNLESPKKIEIEVEAALKDYASGEGVCK